MIENIHHNLDMYAIAYAAYLAIGILMQTFIVKNRLAQKSAGGWRKFVSFNLTIAATIALILVFDHALYAHAIIGIVILFELLKLPLSPIPLKLLVIAFYAILIGLILILTLSSSLNLFFFILLATAIYDGYSQLFGRIFGKVKLAKNISPNKTIAGAVGGFGACLVFGLTFKNTQPIVFLLPPLALAGDLFASALKRKAGVKDFSNILPYQGGFLDRFDSYLFTCLGAIILDLLK